MDTALLAKKLFESGNLYKFDYSLQDLFKIRDALLILQSYGFCDENLLQETEKYIRQKAGF